MFPWGMYGCMPCEPPPAVPGLWAGGWEDGGMGMQAEALQGLQSLSQDPGFRVLTRRPTPHSKRHFPCTHLQMAQLCMRAPMHTRHTMRPPLVFCFLFFNFSVLFLFFSFNCPLFSTEVVWGTILLSCPSWYIWGDWEKPGPRGECF